MLPHKPVRNLTNGGNLANFVSRINLVTEALDQLQRVRLGERSHSLTQRTMHIAMLNPEVEQTVVLHIERSV